MCCCGKKKSPFKDDNRSIIRSIFGRKSNSASATNGAIASTQSFLKQMQSNSITSASNADNSFKLNSKINYSNVSTILFLYLNHFSVHLQSKIGQTMIIENCEILKKKNQWEVFEKKNPGSIWIRSDKCKFISIFEVRKFFREIIFIQKFKYTVKMKLLFQLSGVLSNKIALRNIYLNFS